MQHKKLGPIRLSGLIIGPILGSGIVILPPLGVEVMGSWAIIGWLIMIIVSFVFASIFGSLSVRFPGDAGVSNAVEYVFGKGIKQLTSFYLTGAALFGPVAVLLTAAKYININTGLADHTIAFGVLLFSLFLLLRQITFIGTISFIMSSFAAIILLIGSVLICFGENTALFQPLSEFKPTTFGYGLLLLFWTIVGWEVIGNFTADVDNPKRNLPIATLFSAVCIALVSLAVAGAIQWGNFNEPLSIHLLLQPIFGKLSHVITAIIVFSLCTATYMTFTGAVARLLNALSSSQTLPHWFSKRNAANAPSHALYFLVSIHILVLVLVAFGILNVEKLVSLADGFFLANALIGLLAAIKLIQNPLLKTCSLFLGVSFFGILCFSSLITLLVILIMAVIIPRQFSHS